MAFRRLPRFRLWIDLENFFPPYPRKVRRRCVSPFSPDVMFRFFSYCHVPSYLGNRRLEQGRICVIGSSFSKRVSFFISQIAAVCWYPSNKNLSVLSSLLSASIASRVVLDFILVLSRAIIAA